MFLTKLFLFFFDAFRHDYIDLGYTPFLRTLSKTGSRFSLETLLGYSYAIRVSIFTGVLPCVHGKWSKYFLDPERSPFRDWPWLRGLDVLPAGYIRSATRFALSRFLSRLGGLEAHGASIENVPYPVLRQLGYTEVDIQASSAFVVPSFFDLLRRAGLSWSYSLLTSA